MLRDRLTGVLLLHPYMPLEYMSAIVFSLVGVFYMSPWHIVSAISPDVTNSLALAFAKLLGPLTLGGFLTALGVGRLYALLRIRGTKRYKWRRFFTMTYFLTYLAFATLRLVAFGASSTLWVAIFMLAMVEFFARLAINERPIEWN
jgi:hypothetical protein